MTTGNPGESTYPSSTHFDLERWRSITGYLEQISVVFGHADIFAMGSGSTMERAGELAASLMFLLGPDKRPVVRDCVIVLPPSTDLVEAHETALGSAFAAIEHSVSRTLDESERKELARRISVTSVEDMRTEAAIRIIDSQAELSAVIVTEAGEYRHEGVDPFQPAGASTPNLPEDYWVPQLHELAAGALEAADRVGCYVMLDVNELAPTRPELVDLLSSLDVGILTFVMANGYDQELRRRSTQWAIWIQNGELSLALHDIDTLPEEFADQRQFLRAQLFNQAGWHQHALAVIREIDATSADDSSRLKLAHIANRAGASQLAIDLIKPIVQNLRSRNDLELALAILRSAKAEDLCSEVARGLTARFPDSEGLREHTFRELLRNRDFAGLAQFAVGQNESEERIRYFQTLDEYLSQDDVPDYDELIATAGGNQALSASLRIAGAKDALLRGLPAIAITLIEPIPFDAAEADLRDFVLLETLEAIFLDTRGPQNLAVPEAEVSNAIRLLISRTAGDTVRTSLRTNLAWTLRPALASSTGDAIVLSVLLDLVTDPPQNPVVGQIRGADARWLDARPELREALAQWLEEVQPVIVGQRELPEELIGEETDELMSAVISLATHRELESADDVQVLMTWVAVAVAASHLVGDGNWDLRLLRVTGERLVHDGYFQEARDLAEHILMIGNANPRRRRLAWLAMADIYQRCHHTSEAALALACYFDIPADLDGLDALHGTTTLVRILRDAGLAEAALRFVDQAETLADLLEMGEAHRHITDQLALNIRQTLVDRGELSVDDLLALLDEVTRAGEEAINAGTEPEPPAVLLAQLIADARARGISPSPRTAEVFDQMVELSSGSVEPMLRALATSEISPDDLLESLGAGTRARFSSDVGFDMRTPALLARRALLSPTFLGNAEYASLALEILSDHGVATPNWDERAASAQIPTEVSAPSKKARAISQNGLSVVQAGWNSNGDLVRVTHINGVTQGVTTEPSDGVNREQFAHWATRYPYEYGFDDPDPNRFFNTTADLQWSGIPEGPTLVVADVALKSFPVNLITVEGELMGRRQALAATPSLSWLSEAMGGGPLGDGRWCAWVSVTGDSETQTTLSMVADRLDAEFHRHRFEVDLGDALPEFSGASVALVVAHGGVHPAQQHFHSVSDEGSLQVSGHRLADALRNCGLVILFVCSAGRHDLHPGANTTIGLATEILDRGSSAVVASPWPLDSRVPSHWLPAFLERWTAGERLIDASHHANSVVDREFGLDAAHGLAMTVYGNPLLRLEGDRVRTS